MNWTLEVVVVPVSDVDRANTFYAEKLGFDVDHDAKISEDYHIVQLTPPGSGCSIVVGKGLVDMTPGSLKGLQLVVEDVRAARAQLVERGGGGRRGPGGRRFGSSLGPRRGGPRQRRVRLLQRSGRQRLGRAADIRPRLAAWQRRRCRGDEQRHAHTRAAWAGV
jgi:catechol 2,3-dioxygenase-like lactoylglutathione lyase family enzyme